MDVRLSESWKRHLQQEFEQPYFGQLADFVKTEYATQTIYPEGKNIFRALELCPLEQVKVVVIGQDPYHGPGQAHGLSFSVPEGVPAPPSLQNIFKEQQRDLGLPIPTSGNLERWAAQGVLLLNAVLTVRAGAAASHQGRGWEQFTDAVVRTVNSQRQNVVYMLWGNYAQQKGAMVDGTKNGVLKSVHPSPLSAYRGFIGCGHFSAANTYLISTGQTPINW